MALAIALLNWAADEGTTPVITLAERLTDAPNALADYLQALTRAATYELDLVGPLSEAWPTLMTVGMSVIENRSPEIGWHDRAALLRAANPRTLRLRL